MNAATARCPRCRGKQLWIIETHEEVGATDAGEVLLDESGAMIPPSLFLFSTGDPISVYLGCEACGHEWRSRRAISSWQRDEFVVVGGSDDE